MRFTSKRLKQSALIAESRVDEIRVEESSRLWGRQLKRSLSDAAIRLSVSLSVCLVPLADQRRVLGLQLGYHRTLMGTAMFEWHQ